MGSRTGSYDIFKFHRVPQKKRKICYSCGINLWDYLKNHKSSLVWRTAKNGKKWKCNDCYQEIHMGVKIRVKYSRD